MRRENEAIKRENHLMPTFEDILPRMENAKYFTRLDVKDAFHQIELHESSRYITTFITHKGIFRYKRLMFGISCAPEMFQKAIEQILSKFKNAVNYIDDILLFALSKEELMKVQEEVLKELDDCDILLNHKKCRFMQENIYLGHVISSEA